MEVLLVNPDAAIPPGTAECLFGDGWKVSTVESYGQAVEAAQRDSIQAVVLPQPLGNPAEPDTESAYRKLLRAIDVRRIGAVLLADDPAQFKLSDGALIDVTGRRVTKEELRGRLATLRRYHALVRAMENEVNQLQRLTTRISEHFTELDQDLCLAGRLQRDFLPRDLRPAGPASFATLFRPVAWVSGDIYDIFRIDERHVGFYVADAVGHGMAASLLTMFIKNAFAPKRIVAEGYVVLPPEEVLASLNLALCAHKLPHCQFMTCAYCVLNIETLEMRYARAGHPYPLLISRGGGMSDLKSPGGLLGVFEEEVFTGACVQLAPGDKVLVHSDGLEVSFTPREGEERGWEHYRRALSGLADRPAARLVRELDAMLDGESGSINPQDDVTLIAVEIQV